MKCVCDAHRSLGAFDDNRPKKKKRIVCNIGLCVVSLAVFLYIFLTHF